MEYKFLDRDFYLVSRSLLDFTTITVIKKLKRFRSMHSSKCLLMLGILGITLACQVKSYKG